MGKFKTQAHPFRGVVMDIAVFKVSHSFDIESTALRAARARAVDESSREVQHASTPNR
jgi:hypothetical protein